MSQTQLIFDFPSEQKQSLFLEEDFIFAAENKNAVDFLQKFFDQKSFTQGAFPSFILKGERACGKTHLLHIFAQKFAATFLQQNDLDNINSPAFFSENQFYILENIDKIKSEESLLHTINSASEAKAFLILSAESLSDFMLRDLASRIKNIFTAEIESPSESLIKILLSQGLSRRQLKVGDGVIDFLSQKLKPSSAAISNILKMIEFHCHENKKNFTLTEARKLV